MARLRRPLGAWRLVDVVGTDRRDRRRHTVNTWLDTLWRMVTVEIETVSATLDHSD